MNDILKQLEELKKEIELEKTAEASPDEEMLKLAADMTDGLVKTAEEAQVFHLGRIFGQGMAYGYLEKLAQTAEEAAAEMLADAAAEEEGMEEAPQQVESESVDESDAVQAAMELKQIIQEMTPAEIIAWYEALDPESKAYVDSDPELAMIVDQAYKMRSAQEPSGAGAAVAEE